MAFVASYPGLLTPASVTCSTNAGKGLVKLSHVVWRTWTYGGVAHSFCTVTAVKRLSESKKRRQDCLMSNAQLFYGPCLQSVTHSLTCCCPGMCHSSIHPGTSYHVTQFYQAFPRVSKQQMLGREGLGMRLWHLYFSCCIFKHIPQRIFLVS